MIVYDTSISPRMLSVVAVGVLKYIKYMSVLPLSSEVNQL